MFMNLSFFNKLSKLEIKESLFIGEAIYFGASLKRFSCFLSIFFWVKNDTENLPTAKPTPKDK